jgi:hypothetical protein
MRLHHHVALVRGRTNRAGLQRGLASPSRSTLTPSSSAVDCSLLLRQSETAPDDVVAFCTTRIHYDGGSRGRSRLSERRINGRRSQNRRTWCQSGRLLMSAVSGADFLRHMRSEAGMSARGAQRESRSWPELRICRGTSRRGVPLTEVRRCHALVLSSKHLPDADRGSSRRRGRVPSEPMGFGSAHSNYRHSVGASQLGTLPRHLIHVQQEDKRTMLAQQGFGVRAASSARMTSPAIRRAGCSST